MKATLEFNLPDEQEEFDLCLKARNYFCVLWDLDQELRKKVKYENIPEKEKEIYQAVRDCLWNIMNENDITL